MMAQFEIDYARAARRKSRQRTPRHHGSAPVQRSLYKLTAERNEEYATVLREEVRLALAAHKQNDADALIQKLDQLAAASRDQKVESIYESARGYVMAANGDYANAVDELTSDLHSPLVVQQLIVAQQKLNNPEATEKAQVRLKYLRTPTAEWYVVTKHTTETAQSAAN